MDDLPCPARRDVSPCSSLEEDSGDEAKPGGPNLGDNPRLLQSRGRKWSGSWVSLEFRRQAPTAAALIAGSMRTSASAIDVVMSHATETSRPGGPVAICSSSGCSRVAPIRPYASCPARRSRHLAGVFVGDRYGEGADLLRELELGQTLQQTRRRPARLRVGWIGGEALDWLFVVGAEVWVTDLVKEEALRDPDPGDDPRSSHRAGITAWFERNADRIHVQPTGVGTAYRNAMELWELSGRRPDMKPVWKNLGEQSILQVLDGVEAVVGEGRPSLPLWTTGRHGQPFNRSST